MYITAAADFIAVVEELFFAEFVKWILADVIHLEMTSFKIMNKYSKSIFFCYKMQVLP